MAKGRYIGFDKLKGELAKKPGVQNPAALAASIGRKKYGPKRFNAAAATGQKLGPQRQRPANVPRPGQGASGQAHYLSRPRGDGDTKITEDDPRFNPRTMGNKRGSKNTRTTPGANGQYRPT